MTPDRSGWYFTQGKGSGLEAARKLAGATTTSGTPE